MWLLIVSIIIFIVVIGFIIVANGPTINTNSNRDCDCPNRGPNGCPNRGPNGCPSRDPCNRCGKPKHHCRCNKNVGCPFC